VVAYLAQRSVDCQDPCPSLHSCLQIEDGGGDMDFRFAIVKGEKRRVSGGGFGVLAVVRSRIERSESADLVKESKVSRRRFS
jgi:hypothetical protein